MTTRVQRLSYFNMAFVGSEVLMLNMALVGSEVFNKRINMIFAIQRVLK